MDIASPPMDERILSSEIIDGDCIMASTDESSAEVVGLLPAFEVSEKRYSQVMSMPGAATESGQEGTAGDQMREDAFINAIFDTGLLASATEDTPAHGPTPHCTPSSSAFGHQQGFSPNRIERMFERTLGERIPPEGQFTPGAVGDIIMRDVDGIDVKHEMCKCLQHNLITSF